MLYLNKRKHRATKVTFMYEGKKYGCIVDEKFSPLDCCYKSNIDFTKITNIKGLPLNELDYYEHLQSQIYTKSFGDKSFEEKYEYMKMLEKYFD